MSVPFCPAPWSVTANSWQYTTVYDANGVPVCLLDLEDWGVTEENQDELESVQQGVANLIAAAPTMFDALARLTDLASFEAGAINPGQPFWDALQAARAALTAAGRKG